MEFVKITFFNNKKKTVNNFKKLPEDQKWDKNFFFKNCQKVPISAKKSVESATRCPTKTKHLKKTRKQ